MTQYDDGVTTWREVARRLKEPRRVGPIIMFAILWALLNFNPWVGFGLLFPVMGILGLRGSKKKQNSNIANLNFENQQLPEPKEVPQIAPPQEVKEQKKSKPLHAQVLTDAKSSIAQIKSAANVASGELGDKLRQMVHSLEIVEKGLNEDSSKLSQVQRLFTYYVPSTADILKARGKAASVNDEKRIGEIDSMINRLEAAFADFAARIMGEDARSLEIDIKLLSQSLAAEFDTIPPRK